MPIKSGWLEQVREDALQPSMPIVDAHHHLWDHPNSRYLVPEFLADTQSGHNIVATVYVECGSMYRTTGSQALHPVGETEFIESIAITDVNGTQDATHVAAGIVGFADLSLGENVAEVLEAHIAASPNRFCGIRHAAGWHASADIRNAHSDPPPNLLSQPRFRQGFAQLQKYGLSFDAWLYHSQLDELVNLAQAFPEITLVLDHLGGPLGIGSYADQANQVFKDWCRSINALANCSNVVVKLGGINMTMNGFQWHKGERPPTSEQLAKTTRHFYLYAIERFGVERCMFESNFPVDKVSCSYVVLWNTFKRIVADFTLAEQAALFHDTASRIYRLNKTVIK